MALNIGALIATLGADTRQFTVAMANAQATMRTTGKQMQAVGKQMTLFLSAAIIGVGAAAFSMGKDFEASMQKIVGLVGIAQDQVADWAEEIIRIGPALGKAPKELADALFFVTSAGIRGAEAMDVLMISAKASTSGLGETKVVADLVTSAMNAYGKETLSAAQATDILVATVREGKAEAPELASAMGQVLPIASAMKVSFDQVGAAIASMTRTGTNASTAAIQLRQILASMLKPSQQAEEALRKMGISSKFLKKVIADEGLLAAFQILKDLTKGNEDAMLAFVDVSSKVFPNIRALSGVLDIMGDNVADNVAIFEALKDSTGALDHAFKTASDTMQFKWTAALAEMKTTLTSLGKSIGSVILPMMKRFADRIKAVGDWFRSLSTAQKELTIKIALFVALLGPALIAVGFMVTALGTLLGAFTVLLGPIGLVILAIAAIVAAFIYVVENWEAFKERLGSWAWLENAAIGALKVLVQAFLITFNEISKLFGVDFVAPLLESLDALKSPVEEMKFEFKSFGESIKDFAVKGIEALFSLSGGVSTSTAAITKDISKVRDEINIAQIAFKSLGDSAVGTITLPPINSDVFAESMWKAIESVGPILDMGRFQIEGALLEEEEMIRNSYENRIQVIRNAMAATTLDVSVANEMIRFLLQQMGVEMSKFGKDTQATFFGMTQSTKQWGQMAAGVTTQIGDAMAAMVADSKRGWVGLVMVILRAIQKIILMRLAEAYAGMIAKETGSKGLIGLATAAVGIAAITGLFQTWVNSSMTGLATGGTVTSAGNFIIGEKGPEILNLPIGAAVTPMSQSQAASPGGGTLTAIVSGRDLEFVLNQWDIDKNRMF